MYERIHTYIHTNIIHTYVYSVHFETINFSRLV